MTEQLSPEEVLAELLSSERPHRLVPFPRINPKTGEPYCQIAMVGLTSEEAYAASVAASKAAKKHMGEAMPREGESTMAFDEVLNNQRAYEVLVRACRVPGDLKKPFFKTTAQIAQLFTNDEVAIMFKHYLDVQTELSPILEFLDADEQEAWVKKLTKAGEQAPFLLNSLTSVAMKGLLISLALRLSSSQEDSESSGTQQESIT